MARLRVLSVVALLARECGAGCAAEPGKRVHAQERFSILVGSDPLNVESGYFAPTGLDSL